MLTTILIGIVVLLLFISLFFKGIFFQTLLNSALAILTMKAYSETENNFYFIWAIMVFVIALLGYINILIKVNNEEINF